MTDTVADEEAGRNFTAALKQELKARDWSQKKLAAFIEKDESTVSLWLSGRHGPRLDDELTVRKLTEFLHLEAVEVEQLIAAHKREKQVEDEPDVVKRIHSRRELEKVLDEDLPTFFDRAMPLNTYTRPEGLREALREKGLIVNVALVRQLLKKMCRSRDQFPLGDWYIVEHEEGGFTRSSGVREVIGSEEAGNGPRRVLGRGEGQALDKDSESPLAWFKANFHKEDWVRDAVRQVCRSLNTAFEVADEQLKLEEVRSEVGGVLQRVLPESAGWWDHHQSAKDNMVQALLQALLNSRFLERVGDQVIGRKWRMNSEFLINGLFGIDPQIPGLNFLLDGGLLLPISTGMTVLIKGGSGTGKTTLALQLASSIASQGHVAVYLSAEEDPNLLIDRLSYIGYSVQPDGRDYRRTLKRGNGEFDLISRNCIEPESMNRVVMQSQGRTKGILLLVSIPNRKAFHSRQNSMLKDLSLLQQNIYKLRKGYPGQYICYILDSLDAVVEKGGRRLYEEVFSLAKHQMGLGVFVSEAQQPAGAPALQDYLVDMVIRMGYRMRTAQFKERILEIEKCRTQNHIRGEHLFSIDDGEGITVYSSIQALLSVWRRRIRKDQGSEKVSWKLDRDFDFDGIIKGDMVRGSASLLSGPPATHKFPLGLSFLAGGLKARPNASVLLISFREDQASIIRIIQTYPQFSALLERRGDTSSLSSRLKVLHIPPDYFTPERFIYGIRGMVKDFKKDVAIVSRVLFSNLNLLSQNSPMFKEESLFMNALIELFRKEGVTSLFIDVDHKERTEIHDVFDTIIYTDRDAAHGSDRVFVRVGHSGPCNADRKPRYLDRVTDKGYGRLVLRDVE